MTQEQLLQEARKEAEKVYPTESYVNDARREGYIQCYIQQAEKRKSEAVKFLEWCLEGGWGTTKNGWILNNYTHNFKKSSELFDIFIQQQLKQE